MIIFTFSLGTRHAGIRAIGRALATNFIRRDAVVITGNQTGRAIASPLASGTANLIIGDTFPIAEIKTR